MNCGFTLGRIFVINLLKFCAFFFPLFHAVVQYLFICTLLHLSVHLETDPALLSLSVNKWICIVNTLAKFFLRNSSSKIVILLMPLSDVLSHCFFLCILL
jgi:hypothetical protein